MMKLTPGTAPSSGSHSGPARRRLHGPASRGWILLAPALALVVAACSTASGAPYTYAPPSSPSASSGAGAYPPASASAGSSAMAMPPAPAPSAPASAAPDPTASAGPAGSAAPIGATLHIAAQNLQFDTSQLAAPAGQAWVLEFANNDAGIPHNVEIFDATGASVFKGPIVTGPTTVSYQVRALAAGSYKFQCDVHPTMTGTLTVA